MSNKKAKETLNILYGRNSLTFDAGIDSGISLMKGRMMSLLHEMKFESPAEKEKFEEYLNPMIKCAALCARRKIVYHAPYSVMEPSENFVCRHVTSYDNLQHYREIITPDATYVERLMGEESSTDRYWTRVKDVCIDYTGPLPLVVEGEENIRRHLKEMGLIKR